MHGPIRDRLEDLLRAGRSAAAGQGDLSEHLETCRECSDELQSMKNHAGLLRVLKTPQVVEPTGGFYARVMQRIEERTKDSMWAFFIYSPLSKRLVYASLTLAILLTSYLVGREENDGHLRFSHESVVQQASMDAPVIGDRAQQRDAVLVNLVSTEEPIQ